MWIKFSFRRNLIYIFYLILWRNIRSIELILVSKFLGYGTTLINVLLMFIGEFFAGLFIYLYQKKFLSKKNKDKNAILINFEKKQINEIKSRRDSITKQYYLIFLCAFFDFIEFVLGIKCLPKFINLSGSIEGRLTGMLTITSSLFLFYVMKFRILKHQKVSLVIISIALGIIILTEYLIIKTDIFLSYTNFTFSICIIFLIHCFTSLLDVIEKYLLEVDSLNQFKLLMHEGIFGIILTLIYCIYDSPFSSFIEYFNAHSKKSNIFFIIALIIYVILSGGRNAYRVQVNKLYSPIVKSLTDYFLNPLYNIYYFSMYEDFLVDGNRNIIYFLVNFIFPLIITFFGCVYNEFIILFFCGLEYDTYEEVSKRARISLNNFDKINELENDEYKINDLYIIDNNNNEFYIY